MMTTLYSLPHSPYSTRCRIAIYHKGLDLEIQPPPGGLKSDTYRALVPTKKVPALVTERGILVESGAILEYLEDRFPETSLRASTAEGRAAQRALISFTDFSIAPQIFPLFKAAITRADLESLAPTIATLHTHLTALEALFISEGRDHNELDMADCALLPSLFYAVLLLERMSLEPLFAHHPRLQSWWMHRRQLPAVARALDEVELGVEQFLAARAPKR